MTAQVDGKSSELDKPKENYRSIQWGNEGRMLGEVGKIKIGGKGAERAKKSGSGTYRLPHFTDHFTITTMERDKNGDMIPNKEIMEKIGGNCKELDIMLLGPKVEQNFPTFYAYYKGGTAWCRGNGVTAKRMDMDNQQKFTGGFSQVECPCDFLKPESGRCKPHGILSVVLLQSNTLGGVYAFRTSSWYSTQNIQRSLALIDKATNGHMSLIPLKLKLQMQQVQPKGQSAKTVPICTVVYEAQPGKQLIESLYDDVLKGEKAKKQYALDLVKMQAESQKLLETSENFLEASEITAEWEPQNQTHHPKAPADAQIIEDQVKEKEGITETPVSPSPVSIQIDDAFKVLALPAEIEKIVRESSKDDQVLIKKLEGMVDERAGTAQEPAKAGPTVTPKKKAKPKIKTDKPLL